MGAVAGAIGVVVLWMRARRVTAADEAAAEVAETEPVPGAAAIPAR
jgi:hypothetical protein